MQVILHYWRIGTSVTYNNVYKVLTSSNGYMFIYYNLPDGGSTSIQEAMSEAKAEILLAV